MERLATRRGRPETRGRRRAVVRGGRLGDRPFPRRRLPREHGDLEIAVPRLDSSQIARGAGRSTRSSSLGVPRQGLVSPLEQAGMRSRQLHQTWVREPETGLWRLDVFREPADGETLDLPTGRARIRMPYDQADRADGRRHPVRPAGDRSALQGQATRTRRTTPTSQPYCRGWSLERRRWLADALQLVHPGHRWLERLTDR